MAVSKSELLPVKAHWNLEITITLAGLVFTCIATAFLAQDLGSLLEEKIGAGHLAQIAEQAVFIAIVFSLIYGNVVYQLSRLGFLIRNKRHRREDLHETLHLFQGKAPAVAILVPSYKEETRIIYQTLMSAALQHYPNKRIVLLIDDPSTPANSEDRAALEAARALPREISEFLSEPKNTFLQAKSAFLQSAESRSDDPAREAVKLGALYAQGAAVLENLARSLMVNDHTDRFFAESILLHPAADMRRFAQDLKAQSDRFCRAELEAHYNRLIAIFSAELCTFERKRFENLSHEKNKAMNLNTYIGLIGGNFQEARRDGMLFLEPCDAESAGLRIPDADFIITLDADSLILPDYALRLGHTMLKPGNERMAVIQTPYSAIPGAKGLLERVAGATTDIQLIIHQGFTWCNATFWVGANALLRKRALEDILVVEQERGYPITRYIQDRTVIEDTESSVDLVDAGWSLYNYPSRMAYSATPPDYGALLIQRRRWANGGLIILPKLLRHVMKTLSPKKIAEAFVRIHYLGSIAASSFGVMVLILYPFDNVMRTLWLPLSAVPYFYLYGRDLNLSGYKWADLLRVYALNLLLIPVNLGGVLKSIQQGFTGAKIPFIRTPKVGERTASPPLYVLFSFAFFGYCLAAFAVDAATGRWTHAVFSAVNAAFFAYACTYFLGWKEGLEDIKAGWAEKRRAPVPGEIVAFPVARRSMRAFFAPERDVA